MLTVPAPTPTSPRPSRPRPGSRPPAPTRHGVAGRRQRRTVAVLGLVLLAVIVAGVLTGSEGAWIAAGVVAALTAGYLLAVARVRQLTAGREMTAAFAPEDPLDWESFPEGLALPSGESVSRSGWEPAPPVGTGFDRELILFLGAWVLGLVLTPVVALIRLAGLDLSDPRRRGLIGALVRAQAYGRSQSLKVVAAGLFATAGVTAVAAGGTASAAPTASAGLRGVVAPGAGAGVWAGPPTSVVTAVGDDLWVPVGPAPAAIAAIRLEGQIRLDGQSRFEGQGRLGEQVQPGRRKHHRLSARAARAVRVALAQVGKPYEYGAAGPDAFDCSGLVMYSWGAAGVALPHSAAEQYEVTTHISETQLRPGDLVFYNDFGHVAMYIGGGQVVSANHTGTDVQTQSILWDGVAVGFSRVS